MFFQLRLLFFVSLIIGFLVTCSARAQKKNVLLLVPQGQEELLAPVELAVHSQLVEQGLELRVINVDSIDKPILEQVEQARVAAANSNAVAVFWCDLSMEEQLFLFLAGKKGDRILVRQLEESDPGGRAETLAIIISTSVQEMMEGGKIGIALSKPRQSLEPEPAPPPPPLPVPDKKKDIGIHQQTSYVIGIHSRDKPVHGVDIGLELQFKKIWNISLGYTISTPVRSKTDSASMELSRHPILLGVGLLAPLADGKMRIGGQLSLIFDYLTFGVSNLAQGIVPVSDEGDMAVNVLPEFRFDFVFIKRIAFFMCAGGEVTLNPHYYRVLDSGGEEVLLRPWSVQPRFQFGASVQLF